MKRLMTIAAVALFAVADAAPLVAGDLRGSPASMQRQHGVATSEGRIFARTVEDIRYLVDDGVLIELPGNVDYEVIGRWPYALPEVRVFVERLAQEYHEATGERLVVTSLVRASTRQPSNAHPLSVHPAGMAIDLRVPPTPRARSWLENTLLSLERRGVLDATRERRPPHYHIALFPGRYRDYVEGRWGAEVLAASLEPAEGYAHEHDQEEAALDVVMAGRGGTPAPVGDAGGRNPLAGFVLALFGALLAPGAFLFFNRRPT